MKRILKAIKKFFLEEKIFSLKYEIDRTEEWLDFCPHNEDRGLAINRLTEARRELKKAENQLAAL